MSRRRRFIPLSVVLTGAAMLSAQDDGYDQLVAAWQSAASESADAAVGEFVPKFEAAAKARAGTEAAVPYLDWIVRHGRLGKPAAAALETLATQHHKSLALGPVLDIVPHLATYLGADACMKLVDGALAAGGPPELQARALLARASMVMAGADAGNEKPVAAAAKDLEMARKLAKDPALLATVAQVEVAARGQTIGELMPEIAGFDLDGQPFRLSDYRGKVVVLDFWGDW